MKKIFVVMLIAVLALAVFAGCSGGGASKATEPAEVKGETFEGGNVSALVPDGWMAFHGADMFDEYEEGYDPNAINVVKDAESEFDMLTNPSVQIIYYDADSGYMSPKDFYSDAKDIEPFTAGAYEWTGFSSEASGYPSVVLMATDGSAHVQTTVFLDVDGNKISLDDADVQAILASITPAK